MRFPPSIPPSPDVDTMLTGRFYQNTQMAGLGTSLEHGSAALPHGRSEPILLKNDVLRVHKVALL
ncbi:MAG: hypothetical protein HOL77_03535 [Rhodobacteraceae bacterium]|nr:hypothetical protein [Paracoccaceae bacterium]